MEAKKSRLDGFREHTRKTVATSIEATETTLILLYIFNGVASFLILFDFVVSGALFRRLVGSIAFAFSVFTLVAFVNRGVKHGSKKSKGKK